MRISLECLSIDWKFDSNHPQYFTRVFCMSFDHDILGYDDVENGT